MNILSLGHSHEHHHEYDLAKNSKEGITALKFSFFGLMITAVFQFFIVLYTGSVALLADTIHNFSDALTAIPLWLAYRLNLKQKSKTDLIFVTDKSFHEGIVGLVASRLSEKFNKPAIVVAQGKNHSKASGRSIPGFNLIILDFF